MQFLWMKPVLRQMKITLQKYKILEKYCTYYMDSYLKPYMSEEPLVLTVL